MPALHHRVYIFGASGSGTTTLGRALADHLEIDHIDTDDIFWHPTHPPYTQPRPLEERIALMHTTMDRSPEWVLSGSMTHWWTSFAPRFTLAVLLVLDWNIRRQRLHARETARFGDAIAPGGPMAEQHQQFLKWAKQYDTGGLSMRSRALHQQTLARLPCPTLTLQGNTTTQERLNAILNALSD